jgi:exosortase/archaeosortase family protein
MRRRPLWHAVPLLLSGFILAGLMNIVRVLTITLVWQKWGRDLSTGVLHDVLGYTCLAAAALLLMSADGLFELLLPSVPDVKRPGPVGVFRNPLVAVWNWVASFNFSMLSGFRSAATAAEQAPGNPPAEARSDARMAALNDGLVQHRRWPTGRQWLSPVNWWHFFLGFMESWLYSRPLNAISVALPFVLVGMGCVAVQIWISATPLEPVISFLESQFDSAQRVSNVPRQEICLKALSELRPQDSRYQFRLALFQIENGREQRGVEGIIRLANRPTADSVEARKWLIHQARTEKPLRPLTDEQVEGQLRWVVSNFPRDYEAHEMLARQYIKRQEWHLAEAHLTEAAEARPELNLPLIRLKQDLRRDSANIADRVQLALDALTSRLTEQPASHTIRVALAQTLMLAGRDAEARELLVSGIKSFPDSSLKKELCELELLFAARRLQESLLNRDTCLAMTLAALQSDPGNVAGMQMLMQLHALGARLTSEPLKDSLTFWTKKLEENASDSEARLMLAQLYKLTEEHDAAISHLRPLVAVRPDLERVLAGQLLKVNRNDPEAVTLLTNVIDRSRATLQSTPTDVPAAIAMCDSLMLLNRPDEVRSALQAFAVSAEDGTVNPLPADPALAQFFGRATLAVYDRLTGLEEPWTDPDRPAPEPKDTGADPTTLLTLLSDALRAPTSSGPAIDRLAQLSLADHPAADEAANAARQLRLDGNVSASVLNLMGMHALMKQRYDIAREFLDHARTTSGDNDAMILNNLALAIVRGNPDAAGLDAALRHANRAVELLKDHPDALSTRAEIFIHMERWSEAEADLMRSIASQRDTAENHRLLALAFEGQNDESMAAMHRQRADALEAVKTPDTP